MFWYNIVPFIPSIVIILAIIFTKLYKKVTAHFHKAHNDPVTPLERKLQ